MAIIATGYVVGSGAGQDLLLDTHAVRKSVSGINGNSIAVTLVFIPQTGRGYFVVTGLVLEVTAATGVITQPIVSLGTTAGVPDEIIANTQALSMDAVGRVMVIPVTSAAYAVADGQAVYFAIVAQGTGTTLTLKAHVLGFYSA